MKYILVLLSLIPAALAGSWSGILVDADCYQAAVGNVSPNNTSLASRDMNGNVQSCRPTAKTKSFAIVEIDWTTLTLDAAGDAKARKLVHATKGSSAINVTVTGERDKNTVAVKSLSRAD